MPSWKVLPSFHRGWGGGVAELTGFFLPQKEVLAQDASEFLFSNLHIPTGWLPDPEQLNPGSEFSKREMGYRCRRQSSIVFKE